MQIKTVREKQTLTLMAIYRTEAMLIRPKIPTNHSPTNL